MPASLNSRYRSFPSRVRSPTPQNTDLPPCPLATLLISSWMTTVLPTPAPPKRPIFPPFTNGAIRSTTLMPVSKISVFGSRFDEVGTLAVDRPALGARRDRRAVVDRLAEHVEDAAERGARRPAPRSAAPVSTTSMPRTTPSVDDIATARTWLRPMCCCTSTTTLMPRRASVVAVDLERVVELGQVLGLELDVEHGADDLDDLADVRLVRQ